jgi:MFS family permease
LVAAILAAGDLFVTVLEHPTGWLADRWGHRASLITGSLLQIASMLFAWLGIDRASPSTMQTFSGAKRRRAGCSSWPSSASSSVKCAERLVAQHAQFLGLQWEKLHALR